MSIENEVQQKFDHDLEFGRLGEDFVEAFQNKNTKVEVKTERDIWKTTGNIAVEIRCNGKLSGLSVTEAQTWIHLLSYKGKIEGGFIIDTGYLKDRIGELHRDKKLKIVMGGDNNMSQMALVPINKLFVTH